MTKAAALDLMRRCDVLRAQEHDPRLPDIDRRRLRQERAKLAERAAPYILGLKPYDKERTCPANE